MKNKKVWVLFDGRNNLSVFKFKQDVIVSMEVAGFMLEDDEPEYMIFSNGDGIVSQHFVARLEVVR